MKDLEMRETADRSRGVDGPGMRDSGGVGWWDGAWEKRDKGAAAFLDEVANGGSACRAEQQNYCPNGRCGPGLAHLDKGQAILGAEVRVRLFFFPGR